MSTPDPKDMVLVRRDDLRLALDDRYGAFIGEPEDRLLAAMNAPVVAVTCESCEEQTTRPYVHPVEGIDLCASCVASLPRAGEVSIIRLWEWIDAQHLITRTANRLIVAGPGIEAASNARTELLENLAALLDELERTTNPDNEGTNV